MKTFASIPERIKAVFSDKPFTPIPRETLTRKEYEYHQWLFRMLFGTTPIYTSDKFQRNRQNFLKEE